MLELYKILICKFSTSILASHDQSHDHSLTFLVPCSLFLSAFLWMPILNRVLLARETHQKLQYYNKKGVNFSYLFLCALREWWSAQEAVEEVSHCLRGQLKGSWTLYKMYTETLRNIHLHIDIHHTCRFDLLSWSNFLNLFFATLTTISLMHRCWGGE